MAMEEKQMFGCLTVYRGRGSYLRRLEQLEKAEAAYNEAYKCNSQDVRTLLGRSLVCADAVKPKQAFDDAELALQLEPTNMIAKNMQARAMYTMSDFERSLVMNYRGYLKRRQPPYFLEGINQGLETINDCVGKNAGQMMIDFLPLIRQEALNAVLDESEPRVTKRVSRIPKQEQPKKMTQMETKRHKTLSRVLAMKYLGEMANDKFFLENLTKDSRVDSANKTGSDELRGVINEAYRSLSERQEMLRAQRPYYSVKFSERAESKHQNEYKEELLEKERYTGARTCETLLRKVEQAMWANKIRNMLSLAEQLQKLLDSKTPRNLPDKNTYIDRLYRVVGDGYFNQHRLSYKLSEKSNRRRIAFLMGLPVARPSSYDSVCANYPYKFADIERVTKRVYDTLDMCENSMMRCFLLYEMSRLLSAQKNYPLSKYYAKRCQSEAQKNSSPIWWMNGLFALMSGDMQQGNTNEVRQQVEEAVKYSRNLRDSEAGLTAFLSKCEEIASKAVSSDERKAIQQREREILKIMDEPEKVELQVLFKKISTVPPGRRFSVLPKKAEPRTSAERRKNKQLGLTVVPGAPKALPPMPKSNVKGYQIFDDAKL